MNNIQIDLDNKIIEFIKENTKEAINIKRYIESIVRLAIEKNNIKVDTICISIESATKDEIKKINKEYRKIDKVTDVLSFPVFEREEFKTLINTEESKKFKEIDLGDIILCLDVIKEQAEIYETGIIRETLYMITHGVCHLLGFDHINETEKEEMRNLEEDILNTLGIIKKDI